VEQRCPRSDSVEAWRNEHSSMVGYITDAAYHLGLAAEHEASDDMEAAFAAYKAGIACLLDGVKG